MLAAEKRRRDHLVMELEFPTFRRFFGWLLQGFYWPKAASRVEQRSLLRLILVAQEENLPLIPLIETWAQDVSGAQGVRLKQLAGLLQKGVPLPAALEEVRDVVSEEDVLAIRFGMQSGSLTTAIRDQLAQPVSPWVYGSTRVRNLMPYFSVVSLVAFALVAFYMMRIVPELNKIFEEFDLELPGALRSSARFANVVASYWYLFVLAFIAFWLVAFTAWPGRPLRRRITQIFFRPVRELRVASVLHHLSVAAHAGRPMVGALSTLARYHFDPVLRNQLLFVRNELDHGASLWPCMGAAGLLTAPEVRALETSEPVGDRSWVLAQLAQARRRQTRWRIARWAELVFPFVVLVFGAFVLWLALGMFQSLIRLVSSLAV